MQSSSRARFQAIIAAGNVKDRGQIMILNPSREIALRIQGPKLGSAFETG
jgi:hypothetical protein